jgi:hypothetical protein
MLIEGEVFILQRSQPVGMVLADQLKAPLWPLSQGMKKVVQAQKKVLTNLVIYDRMVIRV